MRVIFKATGTSASTGIFRLNVVRYALIPALLIPVRGVQDLFQDAAEYPGRWAPAGQVNIEKDLGPEGQTFALDGQTALVQRAAYFVGVIFSSEVALNFPVVEVCAAEEGVATNTTRRLLYGLR